MVRVGSVMTDIGAIRPDLARAFDVEERTVDAWIKENEEFSQAIKAARVNADARVERRLFERAVGFEHDSEEIFCARGKVTRAKTRKLYPPETTAAIFWLKNRKPEEWRDKQVHEHTGPNNGPIQTQQADDQMIAQLVAVAGQNPMVKHKLKETLRAALAALE